MFVMPQFWCWCGIRWCAAQDGEQRYRYLGASSSWNTKTQQQTAIQSLITASDRHCSRTDKDGPNDMKDHSVEHSFASIRATLSTLRDESADQLPIAGILPISTKN
jgi:hypothetical protein